MDNLTVTSSPHFRSNNSTSKIMLYVILALLPTTVVGCVYFGINAVLVVLTGVVFAVLSEYIYEKIMKQPITVGDLSAAVTGLLLALNLPSTTPLWMVALASAISIIVVKQLFGGIGCNFANPALVGRIVITLCFTSETSKFIEPFVNANVDATAGATLLNSIAANEKLPELWRVFLGLHAGCIGEVCSLALIVGGVFLVATRVINPAIPLSYILTTYLFTTALGYDGLYSILSGGLLLGAIFMATDYVTSPLTVKGKIIFGIGCGVITTVIRIFGSNAEGVSYAIVFMNVLTPLIDNLTAKKSPFAKPNKKEAKAK